MSQSDNQASSVRPAPCLQPLQGGGLLTGSQQALGSCQLGPQAKEADPQLVQRGSHRVEQGEEPRNRMPVMILGGEDIS